MACDRRLALITLGGAASALVCGCSSVAIDTDAGADASAGPCAGLGTHVGAETDFALGTWTLHGAILVAQDANGFFAFTGVCTHEGCVVALANDKTGATVCPCHGSTFDGDGNVTRGPATASLQHFAVTICNGDVYVDTKKVVAASTRAAPV